MSYKVLDIYKDLARTNCGDCGRGSCFAFATAVFLEGASLGGCPHLDAALVEVMSRKVEQERGGVDSRRESSSAQALRSLLGSLGDLDLAERAAATGARAGARTGDAGGVKGGPVERLLVDCLGATYEVGVDGVRAVGGDDPTVWLAIFLLIYVTRADGSAPDGRWTAFRDLPNTVSKAPAFEEAAGRVALEFGGRVEALDRAVAGVSGRVDDAQRSADRAYVIPVLARVPVLLLFWDRDEEFEARASFLVDGDVLRYLDPEALVFMAEILSTRLCGGRVDEVIP